MERLRAEWANEKIHISENHILNCTFLLVLLNFKQAILRDQILEIADKYLYEAKQTGKNRVCGYKEKPAIDNIPQRNDNRIINLNSLQELKDIAYKVICIWNPDGYRRAQISLEIANLLNNKKNVALLEFESPINPELDYIMEIPLPPVHKKHE